MNQVHGTQYVLLPVDEPGAWYLVGAVTCRWTRCMVPTQYVLIPVDEPGAWYPVGVELVGRDGWEENLLGLSHEACKTNIDLLIFPDYSLLNSAKMHPIFPTLGYVLKGWKRDSLNYFNYISMSIKWIHTRVFNLIIRIPKSFLK